MDAPIQSDRVIYKVEVGSPSGLPFATYDGIGGVKLIPSEPPVLVLNDQQGFHKAIITLEPGQRINFTVTETLKPVDLSVPGTLINHDFTKLVH